MAPNASWFVLHPCNNLVGPTVVAKQPYAQLQAAFPDLERRVDLFFGGACISLTPGVVGHAPPELRVGPLALGRGARFERGNEKFGTSDIASGLPDAYVCDISINYFYAN